MNGTYLTIAGRIRGEIEHIEQVVARTLKIWHDPARSTNDYYVDATALNLHSFYGGVEHVLEMIANGVDQAKPEGGSVRPPVLSVETRKQLDKFRGFRHVVRNIYTFNFDPQRIDELVQLLPETSQRVLQALSEFADFLEATA